MKTPAIKIIVACFLAVGVFAAFIAWFPLFPSLGWPSIALARMGIPHTWVLTVILFLGGITWLGFWSRRQSWSHLVIGNLVIPASYCLLAYLFVARAGVPLPRTTPYDSIAVQRAAYLQAYTSGYRNGMVGFMRTYCFYPEVETRGFEDGAYQGSVVWHRMIGRAIHDRTKRQVGLNKE